MNYHGELFSIVHVISNDFWIIVPRIVLHSFAYQIRQLMVLKKKKKEKKSK